MSHLKTRAEINTLIMTSICPIPHKTALSHSALQIVCEKLILKMNKSQERTTGPEIRLSRLVHTWLWLSSSIKKQFQCMFVVLSLYEWVKGSVASQTHAPTTDSHMRLPVGSIVGCVLWSVVLKSWEMNPEVCGCELTSHLNAPLPLTLQV